MIVLVHSYDWNWWSCWLAGWLAGWLADWLAGWLAGWLAISCGCCLCLRCCIWFSCCFAMLATRVWGICSQIPNLVSFQPLQSYKLDSLESFQIFQSFKLISFESCSREVFQILDTSMLTSASKGHRLDRPWTQPRSQPGTQPASYCHQTSQQRTPKPPCASKVNQMRHVPAIWNQQILKSAWSLKVNIFDASAPKRRSSDSKLNPRAFQAFPKWSLGAKRWPISSLRMSNGMQWEHNNSPDPPKACQPTFRTNAKVSTWI